MQNINILDPNLGQTHPTLVPWVNGMRSAGYTPEQIQMYFRQQMQAQMTGQTQAQQQQQQQMHPQQQQQMHPHQQPQQQQQQQHTPQQPPNQAHHQIQQQPQQQQQQQQQQPVPPNQQFSGQNDAQQQQKLQMARNIAQAYQGRVTLEQILQMPFERVQGLHNEIVSRLNQSGQQHASAQQQQHHQPQAAQAQPQQTRDQSSAHHDYNNNAATNTTANANYTSTYNAYNNNNGAQSTQSHHNNGSGSAAAAAANATATANGAGANAMFDNENPIDIVLVLLHQYPQIETWLQSMEYHRTVTTSRTHAVQFLTSLMDSQPQFTQLIKLIQQQLKQRRAQGGDPSQAAHNIISGTVANTANIAAASAAAASLNNAVAAKAPQMNTVIDRSTSNNMSDPDTKIASKKDRKSSKRSSKNKSKKSSKKKSKKSSKKSSKRTKKKKSKRKKRAYDDGDEDYAQGMDEDSGYAAPAAAHVPTNGNDSGSDFNPSAPRSSSKRTKKKKKKKKKRAHSQKKSVADMPSEAEFTGGETEEDEALANMNMSGDANEDYNPGVIVANVGSRKSDRKRKSKKRNLAEMSNGAHISSRNKRQKTSHNGNKKTNKNLTTLISPAPVHWQLLSCADDIEDEQLDERHRGRFRIKLKARRHPIKEAILKIGPRPFGLNEIIETLADIEEDGEDMRKSKPAKKRLIEELGQLWGCYHIKCKKENAGSKKYGADGDESDYAEPNRNKVEDEFNATEFININITKQQMADNGDISDDVCYQCGKCGELVCCDGCPHAFHLLCVGLSAVPEDKWFCNECNHDDDEERNTNNNTHHQDEERDVLMTDNNNNNNAYNMTNNVNNNDALGADMIEVKSNKGSGIFSAIFMANKGGRIGDLSEINNALHPETSTNVADGNNDNNNNDEDDAFPEPDIDVVAGMEVDQVLNEENDTMNMNMLPSPDASDSGMDAEQVLNEAEQQQAAAEEEEDVVQDIQNIVEEQEVLLNENESENNEAAEEKEDVLQENEMEQEAPMNIEQLIQEEHEEAVEITQEVLQQQPEEEEVKQQQQEVVIENAEVQNEAAEEEEAQIMMEVAQIMVEVAQNDVQTAMEVMQNDDAQAEEVQDELEEDDDLQPPLMDPPPPKLPEHIGEKEEQQQEATAAAAQEEINKVEIEAVENNENQDIDLMIENDANNDSNDTNEAELEEEKKDEVLVVDQDGDNEREKLQQEVEEMDQEEENEDIDMMAAEVKDNDAGLILSGSQEF